MNSNQIRHKPPKTQNNFFNNYCLKSPTKKDFDIINVTENNTGLISNKIQYNYNNLNNNNYYEEIKKAFNFITFILKQKDSQIKQLKIKIKDLQNQLNDINEKNIMTFNNKDILEINSEEEKNKNSLKEETNNYILKNQRILYSNKTSKIKKNNENGNNNSIPINAKIKIINRVKNSTNINKINNYRNQIDLNIKKYNYVSNINNTQINDVIYKDYLNTEENNRKIYLNMKINENSKEKDINTIRKESYHNNMNMKYIIKYKNNNKNIHTYETDTSTRNDKIKVFSLSTTDNAYSKNSKSNSNITFSDEGIRKEKTQIKNYLKEIKNKIEKDKFKKFVTLIKTLIKNKNSNEKHIIINEIKNILSDKYLIIKFESILKLIFSN